MLASASTDRSCKASNVESRRSMSEYQTASIDGQEYRYTLRPEDGTYLFQVNGDRYRFRQWTWGEKNRVTDAATTVDADSARLRVDIARFNELMLATSLVEADAVAPITPAALRELNPVLGDTLLAIAYWINELPATEKKSSSAHSAGASQTRT
jgi:hypothetical protein